MLNNRKLYDFRLYIGNCESFNNLPNEVDRQISKHVVKHSGYRWKLVLVKDARSPGTNRMCLNIEKIDPSDAWTISAILQCDGGDVSNKRIYARFTQKRSEWCLSMVTDENAKRFVCEVTVQDDHLPGMIAFKEKLFNFVMPQKHTDVVIWVKGRKFHVNKGTLGNISTKFAELFEKDLDQKCFEVDFLTQEQFQRILEIIYHFADINVSNVLGLLETCQILGIRNIQLACIRFLEKVPDAKCSYQERILMADRLQMDDFLESTLSLLKDPLQAKCALPEDLKALHDSTVLKLLQKMSDEIAKSN